MSSVHPDWQMLGEHSPHWEDVALSGEEWAQLLNLYFYKLVRPWENTWRGVPVIKPATDLWAMAEVLHETRPGVVIETGTFAGGSALFYAEVSDAIVVTIDIERDERRPEHDRIVYLWGSSVDPSMPGQVLDALTAWSVAHPDVALEARCMVVLDSDHSTEHVYHELETWAPYVGPGCYLVVEDTNLHLIDPDGNPGPYYAVERFLKEHPEWERDRERERQLITFHPGGWLRRRGT